MQNFKKNIPFWAGFCNIAVAILHYHEILQEYAYAAFKIMELDEIAAPQYEKYWHEALIYLKLACTEGMTGRSLELPFAALEKPAAERG